MEYTRLTNLEVTGRLKVAGQEVTPGGGGVLVCHVDFTTLALDKTYREVVNADVAVLKSSEEGIAATLYLSDFDDLPAAANSGTRASGSGWTGHITFVNISGIVENSELPKFIFVTSDPDGYPVLSQ